MGLLDLTVGSKVVSTGGNNVGLINGDDSTIGMGDQGWGTSEGGASVAESWNSWSRGNSRDSWNSRANKSRARCNSSMECGALGSQVIGPGCNNSGLVSGGHGTIGVRNKLWDTGQGSGIWQSWGNGRAGNWCGNGSPESSALGGQVVGPGGNNSGFVCWDNSSAGDSSRAKGSQQLHGWLCVSVFKALLFK